MVNKNSSSFSNAAKATTTWSTAAVTEAISVTNTSGSLGIGFGDTGNGRDYLAQGFIATADNITAVSVWMNDLGTQGLRVWIDNADSNSNPQGAVAVGIGGATEIPNASIVSALTKYTLTTPVRGLTVGNRYCLCMAPWNITTHLWASDYRDVRSSTSNPYPDGRRVHLDNNFANPTAPDAGADDIQFSIYSRPTWTNSNKST